MDNEIQKLIDDGDLILAVLSVGERELLQSISDDGNANAFVEIFNAGEYGSVEYILAQYAEDKRHFEFMAGDVDDLVLTNSDDADYVQFAIAHYDVDIEWIQDELRGERDCDSASLMNFNLIIGTSEEVEQEEDEVGMSGEEAYYDGQ